MIDSHRIFEASPVMEKEVVDNFAEKYCFAGTDPNASKKRANGSSRELLDREPAIPGEQVSFSIFQFSRCVSLLDR